MFQAIQTRYIGPTNFKGSRVKAYAQAGAVTVPHDDDDFTAEEKELFGKAHSAHDRAHSRAAYALAKKYGWAGVWLTGGAPDGRGDVFVKVTAPNASPDELQAARLSPSFAFEVKP